MIQRINHLNLEQEINDESRGGYNDDDDNNNDDNNNNIKSTTTIIRSSLCDYSDALVLVKGIITAPSAVNKTNKKSSI